MLWVASSATTCFEVCNSSMRARQENRNTASLRCTSIPRHEDMLRTWRGFSSPRSICSTYRPSALGWLPTSIIFPILQAVIPFRSKMIWLASCFYFTYHNTKSASWTADTAKGLVTFQNKIAFAVSVAQGLKDNQQHEQLSRCSCKLLHDWMLISVYLMSNISMLASSAFLGSASFLASFLASFFADLASCNMIA